MRYEVDSEETEKGREGFRRRYGLTSFNIPLQGKLEKGPKFYRDMGTTT